MSALYLIDILGQLARQKFPIPARTREATEENQRGRGAKRGRQQAGDRRDRLGHQVQWTSSVGGGHGHEQLFFTNQWYSGQF